MISPSSNQPRERCLCLNMGISRDLSLESSRTNLRHFPPIILPRLSFSFDPRNSAVSCLFYFILPKNFYYYCYYPQVDIRQAAYDDSRWSARLCRFQRLPLNNLLPLSPESQKTACVFPSLFGVAGVWTTIPLVFTVNVPGSSWRRSQHATTLSVPRTSCHPQSVIVLLSLLGYLLLINN